MVLIRNSNRNGLPLISFNCRDCYVAVSGIPTPRSDHAVAMAKFARQCLEKMNALTKTLEVKLVRLNWFDIHCQCVDNWF